MIPQIQPNTGLERGLQEPALHPFGIEVGTLVVQRAEVERGGRGMFHAAGGVFVDANLGVLGPGITHAATWQS